MEYTIIINAASNTAKIGLEGVTLAQAIESAKAHAAAHPMPASWRVWADGDILAEGVIEA
jgi:hypothetical protein